MFHYPSGESGQLRQRGKCTFVSQRLTEEEKNQLNQSRRLSLPPDRLRVMDQCQSYQILRSPGSARRTSTDQRRTWSPQFQTHAPGNLSPRNPIYRRSMSLAQKDASQPGPLTLLHMVNEGLATTSSDFKEKERRSSGLTPPKSPSRIEQQFLMLPESSQYEKLLTFGIDSKSGELTNQGYRYRRKSTLDDLSRSPSCSPTASIAMVQRRGSLNAGWLERPLNVIDGSQRCDSSERQSSIKKLNETDDDILVRSYLIYVLGAESVGKTSLIKHFLQCDLAWNESKKINRNFIKDVDDQIDEENFDNDNNNFRENNRQISESLNANDRLRVLVAGQEIDLFFQECDVDQSLNFQINDQCAASIVLYSVTSSSSFETAQDILNQIRDRSEKDFPIFLVANKMDLQRHRIISTEAGDELANSFDCKFLEASVDLGCETEELLKDLLFDLNTVPISESNPRCQNSAFINYIRKLSRRRLSTKKRAQERLEDLALENSSHDVAIDNPIRQQDQKLEVGQNHKDHQQGRRRSSIYDKFNDFLQKFRKRSSGS